MSYLASALMLAIKVHADQRDKQGEPYLLHVLRVVEAVSHEAKVVAALHDVFEDAPETILPTLLTTDWLAVQMLSRGDDEIYSDYIRRIAEAPGKQGGLAREVKTADLRDNLGRIPSEADLAERREAPDFGPFVGPGADPALHTNWTSLKARYEKALATLEATTPHPAHERARADQEED